ncbi:membrane fusion protein (multidrug efflux system) [Zhongshania antarctica]|uniref:Membrane fusion protein (Multidrug efflux system) n=1 Tax=Zhongshania antarctica TaxID=641702 RepID=A0A840R2G1_9GAMM|nr:efflux RND transporter periplasmic adaptor subunit [Zhongshania antarctica]MBB5186642.1 membrane fusion protein (multidrug efflux system) [Zhongshania antarctica]
MFGVDYSHSFKSILSYSSVCLLSLSILACQPAPEAAAPKGRPPTPVKVQALKTELIQTRLQALGSLLARESVDISSSVTEKIQSLHFDDGQTVKSGDLLVTLEQAEEAAQLKSARADLAEHERELQRLKGLLAKQSAAQTEYDQRQTSKLRAESKIAEISALLNERSIRAPFSGVVGLRELSPGALLSPGTRITSLDDLSVMRLDFYIPSLNIKALALGQEIIARSDALNEDFSGHISAIDSRIDPIKRSLKVRALIPNADGHLKPGMLMQVVLITSEREGILIPESALLSEQLHHYVWLLSDGKAEQRQVELGVRKPGFVEVRSGLSAGEQLIYEGIGNLQAGMAVAPQGNK